jgi:hypothetical protein
MKSSSPVSCRPAENAMAQPLRRAFARSARDAPQPSTHPHVRVSCVYLLLPCSFGAKDEDCLAPKVKVRAFVLSRRCRASSAGAPRCALHADARSARRAPVLLRLLRLWLRLRLLCPSVGRVCAGCR